MHFCRLHKSGRPPAVLKAMPSADTVQWEKSITRKAHHDTYF